MFRRRYLLKIDPFSGTTSSGTADAGAEEENEEGSSDESEPAEGSVGSDILPTDAFHGIEDENEFEDGLDGAEGDAMDMMDDIAGSSGAFFFLFRNQIWFGLGLFFVLFSNAFQLLSFAVFQ